MRYSVIATLTERARNDADFRARVREDLEGTLQAEGYELEDDELRAVREFHARAAGLSDEELANELSGDAVGQG